LARARANRASLTIAQFCVASTEMNFRAHGQTVSPADRAGDERHVTVVTARGGYIESDIIASIIGKPLASLLRVMTR
jgi:hypothetical protein